jgi:hypothetical protein
MRDARHAEHGFPRRKRYDLPPHGETLHHGVEVGFPYGKVGGATFRIAEDEKDPGDNA